MDSLEKKKDPSGLCLAKCDIQCLPTLGRVMERGRDEVHLQSLCHSLWLRFALFQAHYIIVQESELQLPLLKKKKNPARGGTRVQCSQLNTPKHTK